MLFRLTLVLATTISSFFLAGRSPRVIQNDLCFFAVGVQLETLAEHLTLRDTVFQQSRVPDSDWRMMLHGHRIMEGTGIVLAHRSFRKLDDPNLTDTTTFQKTSIYLKHETISELTDRALTKISGSDPENVAFWSRANSSFYEFPGCVGYVSSGDINLRVLSDGNIQMDINVTIKTRGSRCEISMPLNLSCIAAKRSLESLTPWEGVNGKHAMEESFPNETFWRTGE